MTDLQRRMMEKLGLTEENFKPKKNQLQRITEAENNIKELQTTSDDMVLMMADLIGGE